MDHPQFSKLPPRPLDWIRCDTPGLGQSPCGEVPHEPDNLDNLRLVSRTWAISARVVDMELGDGSPQVPLQGIHTITFRWMVLTMSALPSATRTAATPHAVTSLLVHLSSVTPWIRLLYPPSRMGWSDYLPRHPRGVRARPWRDQPLTFRSRCADTTALLRTEQHRYSRCLPASICGAFTDKWFTTRRQQEAAWKKG